MADTQVPLKPDRRCFVSEPITIKQTKRIQALVGICQVGIREMIKRN
jgi:hypothetical protein